MRLRKADSAGRSRLLYGYIDTRQNPPELVLKFWIAPQANYEFEEIQGSYRIGESIRIVDINNPGTGVEGELKRQSTAIAWVGIGLTNQQLGQSADALQGFADKIFFGGGLRGVIDVLPLAAAAFAKNRAGRRHAGGAAMKDSADFRASGNAILLRVEITAKTFSTSVSF